MPTAAGTSPTDIRSERITITARDGYLLGANRFYAEGEARGNLLVAGGTGVPQRFYRRFAEHAARRGFNVLTIDYRGTGESKPTTLKGFDMSYLDWPEKDLPAAVDLLSQEDLPLYWVGHSFGGHAIGMLPNHDRLTASYSFGTGAGWAGWMPKMEAFKIRLFWNVIMPVIVAWKGYMAWSVLGMGDDLPRGVYRDWKRWCSFPHYYFDDPTMLHVHARYAAVCTPSAFVTSRDDPWAPPQSRDAFVKGYSNAPLTLYDIEPAAGQRPIGHMGYFRSESKQFWDEALDWLLQAAPVITEGPQAATPAHLG